jgi:hypothetical protein
MHQAKMRTTSRAMGATGMMRMVMTKLRVTTVVKMTIMKAMRNRAMMRKKAMTQKRYHTWSSSS